MKKDIESIEDIREMVNHFYASVQEDDLIGPIFNGVIQDRWPEHLNKMYGFWQTILLNERAYSGSPFPPHAKLPVNKSHFDRWIQLFKTAIFERFEGEKANEAVKRAEGMAVMFNYKIEYLKNQSA